MIELVFGRGTGSMLKSAGVSEKNIYSFDLSLSVGNLMEKKLSRPDRTADTGRKRRISAGLVQPRP